MSKMAGFFAQFSPQQLRDGYARNARQLDTMATKAERTGRKVNGFTAEYLRAKATEYTQLSQADDAAILAHVLRPSPGPDRWKRRSITYTGIAEAMADQWGS